MRIRQSIKERSAFKAGGFVPYLFMAPALIIVSLTVVYPALRSIHIAFYDWDIMGRDSQFIGLANFRELVDDPIFWQVFRNTVVYLIGVVVVPFLIALPLAVVLNTRIPGSRLLRSIFFVPMVSPIVVMALVFTWIFQGDLGILSHVLQKLNFVDGPVYFLLDRKLAMPSVMVVIVWSRVGYYAIILLAGIQAIPTDLFEAAYIDGASYSQVVRRIMIPLLRNSIIIIWFIGGIDTFKQFGVVWAMTQGDPLHRTEVLGIYLYQYSFGYMRFGYAASVAVVLFLISGVLTTVSLRLRREVY
jgi:ABC-type sugar transport system permease subunit